MHVKLPRKVAWDNFIARLAAQKHGKLSYSETQYVFTDTKEGTTKILLLYH